MIKIAFVIDTIDTPGAGTEKQLFLLLKHLDRSKFAPHLVCLRDSEWLQGKTFDFPLVKYNAYSMTGLQYWKYVRQFAAWCRREEIDIVQVAFFDATLFGTVGARLARRPLLVSTRRNIGNWHNSINLRVLRLLRRWTTRYLANSQAAIRRTIEVEYVEPDRFDLIYNGLDLAAFSCITPAVREAKRRAWGLSEQDTVVGIVANLRDVKNISSLIDVTARLAPDFPRLKVVSVGEGPYRDRLVAQVKACNLENRFLFVGRDTDVISCLAAFDIATLTSRFESFSNSLIEYMAAGLPIVASNIGGNGEAVAHEETGLLYDVDNNDELEQYLRRLLTDTDFARQIGDNARRDAHARFTFEACIKAHEDYYTDLLRHFRPGRV